MPGVEMNMFELDALGSKAHGYIAKPAGEGKFPARHPAAVRRRLRVQRARAPRERAAEGWLMVNVDSHDKLPSDPVGQRAARTTRRSATPIVRRRTS